MRDRAPTLCLVALAFLPLLPFPGFSDDDQTTLAQADTRLLKEYGLSSERAVLRTFFQLRTLTDADRARLPGFIQQLGNDAFEDREAAQAALLARGPSIRDLLEKNRNHADPEIARRVRELIDRIDNGPGIELTSAALRQFTRTPGNDAVAVLLDYLPFAEDPAVTDQVLEGLARSVTAPAPEVLHQALASTNAERRAAAAYVLGRSADLAVRDRVLPLLTDKVVAVRHRAIQGLLAAKEPKAVTAMIDLIPTAPLPILGSIEATLFNLAGTDTPQVSSGTGSPDDRRRCRDGWAAWWKANAGKVDLARASRPAEFLGLTVVPEMHANKVWECGRDGKPRWELAGLHCPIDAQVLPGGRLLVAELNGHRVTERDHTGKIFWEHKVNTPIACQRLANGSTWIATNHRFFTVDRAGTETQVYTPENGFFIHSAFRTRQGNVAIVSMGGEVREVSPGGLVIRKIPLSIQGSWSGISVTPNGHYLVTNNGSGKVQEISQAGKVVWEFTDPAVCYATRLPGGNTLVVNNNFGLREVDREGKVVWEQKVGTSLWRGHRR